MNNSKFLDFNKIKDFDELLDLIMDREYCNYHKHCHYSNIMSIDSTVKPIDYINRCLELRHRTVFSTQHGVVNGYHEYYDLCTDSKKLVKKIRENINSIDAIFFGKLKKDFKGFDIQSAINWVLEDETFNGIEFRFGVEIYFSIDITKNQMYHFMLIAKNKKGMEDITELVSECCFIEEGGYRNKRPKVPLERILKLNKEDVVVTTACVGTYISKHEHNELITEILHKHFKESFYLEVQYHNTDMQKSHNKKVIQLSKKFGIPLIAGMDSHVIYEEQTKDRDAYLHSKGIFYEDEDGWMLDYPDYQTSFGRFLEQNVLSHSEILQAMENTRIILDFDNIELNKEVKLPTIHPNLTQEERNKLYMNLLIDNWNKYKHQVPEEKHIYYMEEMIKESNIVTETGMTDYFLLNYEVIKKATTEYGGIITRTGRGCFVGDTKVLTTNKGYINIKDVVVGDTVINRFGDVDTVINTLQYDVNEKLYTISSYGNKDITLTNNHKVYVYDTDEKEFKYIPAMRIDKDIHMLTTPIKVNNKKKVDKFDLSNYCDYHYEDNFLFDKFTGSDQSEDLSIIREFSPALLAELKIAGSTANWKYRNNQLDLNSPIYKKIFDYTGMTPDEYSFYIENINMTRKISRYIENDKDLMTIIGAILGDGHIKKTGNKISIYLSTQGHKDDILKNKLSDFCNRYSLKYSINKSKDKNMQTFNILSNAFRTFIIKEFGIYDNKKNKYLNINKILKEYTHEELKGLFDGLMLSDGSFDNSGAEIRYCFDNKSDILNVLFNILCHKIMTKPTSRTLDKRYNAVKTRTLRKYFIVKDNYICTKIKDVYENDEVFNGKVYDLTIRKDPSFIVENAVVHNSAPSFFTNMLLGFTNIDRISAKITMYASRFMSKSRILQTKSLPDYI